jgi:Zn-finger nucleic acid-binding protein
MTPHRTTHNEDEYFAKHDAELLEERKFHTMVIDVCPECEGTWLDAGELEMLSFVRQSELQRFINSLFGLK